LIQDDSKVLLGQEWIVQMDVILELSLVRDVLWNEDDAFVGVVLPTLLAVISVMLGKHPDLHL
jgi:hypothetical protein